MTRKGLTVDNFLASVGKEIGGGGSLLQEVTNALKGVMGETAFARKTLTTAQVVELYAHVANQASNLRGANAPTQAVIREGVASAIKQVAINEYGMKGDDFRNLPTVAEPEETSGRRMTTDYAAVIGWGTSKIAGDAGKSDRPQRLRGDTSLGARARITRIEKPAPATRPASPDEFVRCWKAIQAHCEKADMNDLTDFIAVGANTALALDPDKFKDKCEAAKGMPAKILASAEATTTAGQLIDALSAAYTAYHAAKGAGRGKG